MKGKYIFAKFKTELLTNEDMQKLDLPGERSTGVVRFTSRKGNVLYVTVNESDCSDFSCVSFRLFDKDCKLLEETFVDVGSISPSSSFDRPEKKAKSTILFQAGLKLSPKAVGKKFYRKAAWRVAAYARKMKKLEKKRKELARKEAQENMPAFQAVKKFFDR